VGCLFFVGVVGGFVGGGVWFDWVWGVVGGGGFGGWWVGLGVLVLVVGGGWCGRHLLNTLDLGRGSIVPKSNLAKSGKKTIWKDVWCPRKGKNDSGDWEKKQKSETLPDIGTGLVEATSK